LKECIWKALPELGGEGAGVVYDVSSILVGGRSAFKNAAKISGKQLNDILKSADVTINTGNSTCPPTGAFL